jgi:nucleoside-diphosphate-sugar epimerase
MEPSQRESIMKIFLTGATGFIGSAIIPELLDAGHQVLGLTRSDAGFDSLKAAGVEPHRGNIEDLDSLRSGAEKTDGVIHCAFNHDFSRFVQNCEDDRNAIKAIGEVLVGSDRPFIYTSGVGMGSPGNGQIATEDVLNTEHPNPRTASELAGQALAERGVNVSVVRLPQVHNTEKAGLIPYVAALAKEKGRSVYVNDGANRWSAGHVSDVARLYKLAFEKAEKGARYHAVDEEGVTAKAIAEVIGRNLNIPIVSITPEEVPAHFGWMAMFASMDLTASSKITQEKLNWHPTGPKLIPDLEKTKF